MSKAQIITVVMVEPRKPAYVKKIKNDLEYVQGVVGGYIEAYYPFESPECIVCNEEGKINGMVLNREITDTDGKLIDIIAGPFFIADCSGEDFGSLSVEKQKYYLEKFKAPERFFRINGELIVRKEA